MVGPGAEGLVVVATAWISAIAAAVAAVNGVLQWRHRREDDRRFAEVHEKISNGG